MTAQVAFSKDFLEAYSSLHRRQQKLVRNFTEKFRQDPTRPGINFERINGAVDSKVRSVRIDQAYRAIVVHPPKGDVYLLVWVDKHDEAYAWVRNKQFEVNPKSGVFQIYDIQAAAAYQAAGSRTETPAVADSPVSLFANLDEESLLLAGVPAPLLASVQALMSDDDLDKIAGYLPDDCADVLYLIAAGYSLIEAVEETEGSRKAPKSVDIEDFSTALAKPESQRAFKIVDGETELEAMLDAPLEQWRVFLHPSQRRLVKMNASGPVRVLGGAGTGKTVVLMHRAKHLLDQVFVGQNDRILVTTFTRNLAIDLEATLASLCGEQARRLDIVHLHGWAKRFMQGHGYRFSMVTAGKKRRFFQQALNELGENGLPLTFYLEEWDRVVLPQEVDGRDAYFTARRVGRGTRLSRAQRAIAWKVFARYRELLEEHKLSEWSDLVRETRQFIEKGSIGLPYSAVLSDEIQDFAEPELRLLRAIAPVSPNSLFLVGDGHQRIYGHPARLSLCGIEIRGRSKRLRLNYRTTEQISRKAIAILHGIEIDDLDGGIDTLKGYKSLRAGPAPMLVHFDTEAEESEFVLSQIKQWLGEGIPAESICVAARTNSDIDERYLPMLKREGVTCLKIERDPVAEGRQQGVRLATMHRLKGLEYSRVLLASIQKGKMPLEAGDYSDHAALEDQELRERCLLYVACTRARDQLVIAGFGSPSPFLC